MPGIVKKWLDLISLANELRELKRAGYRRGSWEWIPGTDKIELKAWRSIKNARANRKIPRKLLVSPAQWAKERGR